MKKTLCLFMALLLICALCGCGAGKNSASGSNLEAAEIEGFPVSAADVTPLQDNASLLLENGGGWRSEQQTVIDSGVIVRELCLRADGSFTYREGDQDSEFCYFARGSWSLDGDFLRFTLTACDETFAEELPGAEAVSASYAAVFQDGSMALRQTSDSGFSNGEAGLTVYYYPAGE